MWVFGSPNWCPHNAPAARITISHSFIDFRVKEAKRETARSLLLIGTWGPFKRYTVSTIGMGLQTCFPRSFPDVVVLGVMILSFYLIVSAGFYYSIGGSRVGTRGARASPLVLDQTEVRRRADKKFFQTAPFYFRIGMTPRKHLLPLISRTGSFTV